MSDTVIKVENLSKEYRLGLVGSTTFVDDVKRCWARLRGREDPTLKVGETNDRASRGHSDYVWALRDINFEVKQGEVLGIIGSNGAGKSTLLKILSRVTAPTQGEVKIKGRIASLLEVGTGFHPELTGRENIYLNGAIMGMNKHEVSKKLDEIIDFSGCERYIDTPVKRYSSGMTVRLGFAVAAHLEPDILIVDEVLAVGDAEFQQKCLGKMQDAAGCGRTVLFVSHQLGMLQKLCPKAVWMKNGSILKKGYSHSVVSDYLDSMRHAKALSIGMPKGYLYYHPDAAFENGLAITGIQMLDSSGNEKLKLQTWDPVTFRIQYRSEKRFSPASVEFKVSTPFGTPLTLFSTKPDNHVSMDIQLGENTIDLSIENWPYACGDYRIGVSFANPGKCYIGQFENICSLFTDEKDVFNSGFPPYSRRYHVAIDHHWEIDKTALS